MSTPTRPLIAGNWKMNGTDAALDELARLKTLLGEAPGLAAEVLVCPPSTLIHRAAQIAEGSDFRVGGQDCHWLASGAHTGDISAAMLLDAGASHVILGHSERRADHGETDAIVREKTKAALAGGLVPIVCVGETEAERVEGRANRVIAEQLAGSLPDESGAGPMVIAYEPVWAIGTGRTATLADIAEMHAHMRALLVERFGEAGRAARLLYGGSVKPSNAAEILAVPDVDGALVGGASLMADDFFSIVVAA
ncbi:triose-phosphate isomerase [Pelagibacterium lacus]|uniref:Triosephosphate isomerase n=1 Tax=Pelagibacterium lacus TaxID=2282655 RepID=A0A369W098_9HYPH|nr:triose-phosphate isomerase [Pelagibacterium lacus]RDE07978.1 triose-phosphate isomerase [Pelagibacterium lacus]